MEKVVFLIRSADVEKKINLDEDKMILSVNGESDAKKLSENEIFNNVNAIYSSDYVRTLSTAKYLAKRNKLSIVIDDRLRERKIGNLDVLDNIDYYKRQYKDFNFKLNCGESLNQVKTRMTAFLKEVLNYSNVDNICIYSHPVAIISLLTNWCGTEFNLDDKVVLTFKENVIIDDTWNSKEIIKIVFDDMKVLSIERIEM